MAASLPTFFNFGRFLWQIWPQDRHPQKKIEATFGGKHAQEEALFFSSVFVQEKCGSPFRAPFTTPLGSIVTIPFLGWWMGICIIWIPLPAACTNSTPETYNLNIKFYNSLQYYLKLFNILLICGIPKLNSHARNLCQNNISDLHPPSSALWPSRARLW